MFSNQSAEISIDANCKALSALRADKVESRFVLGTSSVRDGNSLQFVRFHSDLNELGVDGRLPYEEGPLSLISTSPSDPSMIITVSEDSASADLWRIPASIVEQSSDIHSDINDNEEPIYAESSKLDKIETLTREYRISDVQWRDGMDDVSSPSIPGDILTIDSAGCLSQWDLQSGSADPVRVVETLSTHSSNLFPQRAAWDPHANGDAAAVSHGASVSILDLRQDKSVPSGMVDAFTCHRCAVSSLDYNPNKPYVLATGGCDGLIKYWDLRSAAQPLLTSRGGHSHWIWNVQYNPFHDQLVLSTGTDAVANLWRLSTISSAPLLTLDEEGEDADFSESSGPNIRVRQHEHSDSVYASSWSAADAWIYMTVGYDGKAILSHVPSKEKYKILL